MELKINDNNTIGLSVQEDEITLLSGDTINIGISDYEELINKPHIEGVELIGDVSLDDIGAASADDIPTKTSQLQNDSGYITDPGVASFNGSTGDVTYTAPVVSVNSKTGTVTLSASDVGALPDTTPIPTVPTDISAFNNDVGYITGMTILSYGHSTYADALAAYQANRVIYCRASSNSNPGTGNQLRLAFLAYVNDATTPTEFDFQYYRSVATHSDSQQGDQVFVYKLKQSTGWEVSTRETYTKIVAGTNVSGSYSNGELTLSATDTTYSEISEENITDGTGDSTGLITGRRAKKAVEAFGPSKTSDLENDSYFARGRVAIFNGTCSTAAETAEKLVTCPDFTANDLVAGAMILVTFNNTNSAPVANIKLNVNNTGAYSIKQNNSGTMSNLGSAGYLKTTVTYPFIFDGTYWQTWYDTNTNTIGYTVRTNALQLPVKTACYRYRLLFTSADGEYYIPANASTSTNATSSRTTTSEKIDPHGRIVYYSYTTALSANGKPGTAYQMEQYAGISIGYSFCNGSAINMTVSKPIYLKCSPQADGSAIINSTTPYVQALPTTNDGYIYIFLGVATSATAFELTLQHPVYYHDGTALRKWTGPVT